MKKTFLLLIYLTFASVYAQNAEDIYAFQSPEAAELGFVSAIPVDLYVGRTAVSIPLFEVSYCGYPMSIGLNYNSDGFKPNIQHGWVGQNWNLQAGGVITRIVKGQPDETPIYGLFYSYDEYLSRDPNFAWAAQKVGKIDTEPDEFHFSVNGLSGVFYLNPDRTFTVVSNPGVKVEYDENAMESIQSLGTGTFTEKTFGYFKITDPKGNQYYFGNASGTKGYVELSTNTVSAFPRSVATSWNLNYIALKEEGLRIEFDYSDLLLDANVLKTEKRILDPTMDGPYDPVNPCDPRTESHITIVNYVEHQYLKSILCRKFGDNGWDWKLDFYTSNMNFTSFPAEYVYTGNKISPHWQRLDSIVLRTPLSENAVKSVQFKYDSNAAPRFFLTSIKETGKPEYRFEYYNQYNARSIAFDSDEIDHWGFYNGFNKWAETEYSQIPKVLPFKYQIPGLVYYPTREANPSVANIGMLSKIKYPTGAETEFLYEPNTYSTFMRYDIDNSQPIPVLPLNVTKRWSDFRSKTLLVYPDSFRYYGHQPYTITFENPAYAIITINAPYASQYTKKVTRFFEAGTLDVLGFIMPNVLDDGWPGNTLYSCMVKYQEIIPSAEAYSGGIRIKEIRQRDYNGHETIKEYKYTQDYANNPNGGLSTGILGAYPYYGCAYATQLAPPFYSILSVQKSTTKNAQEYTKGRQVGYSYVTEVSKDSDGKILGYVEYRYTNFDTYPDHPPRATVQASISNDYNAKTSWDFARGKLLQETIHDGGKSLLQINQYTYEEHVFEPMLTGVFMLPMKEDLLPCSDAVNYYSVMEYDIKNSTFVPISQTKTECIAGKYIRTGIQFAYNDHDLLKEQTICAEDTIKATYTYPADYTAAPYPDMVERNMLSYVVEKKTYENGRFAGASKTDYGYIDGFYKPARDSYSKALPTYQEERTYELYDMFGNVVQYADKDGIRTVLLWGHNSQCPIFVIRDMTYDELDQVFGVFFFNPIYENALYTDETIRELDEELRAKLPGKQITTYTYKPLVGVTSVKAPNGQTTHYSYDAFGRFQESYLLINGAKKTIETYDYHYSNQ